MGLVRHESSSGDFISSQFLVAFLRPGKKSNQDDLVTWFSIKSHGTPDFVKRWSMI
jgi:hypothetical protein